MSIISFGAGTKGQLTLRSKTENLFLMERFVNTLLPYQSAIPVFSFMELNNARKFIRNRMNTSGVFWQPHVPCEKTPQGGVSINALAVEPCALDFFMEPCSEMWGSCFDYMDKFNADGSVDTEEFNRILELVVMRLRNEAANQLLSVLFLGKFFSNQSGLTLNPNVSAENTAGFVAQEAHCTGLLWYLTQNIPSCEVFNGINYTACNNVEDIIAMLERLRCCAQDQDANFGQIVNLGYVPGNEEAAPVMLLSANLYGRIMGTYTGLQNIVSPQFSPIGKRMVTGANGGTYDMFTFHGIPIVPVGAINAWDKHYTGIATQFAAMTVAGNIEFGSNYAASLVSGDPEPVAFQIAPKPGLENANVVQISGSALLDVNVVNPELLVWDVSRVTNV